MSYTLAPSRRVRVAATVAAGSLALAACGGSGGDLPSDPNEAIAQALQNSLDEEFTMTLSLELSDAASAAALAEMGADLPPEFAEEFLAGAVTIAGAEGQFAVALSFGDEERFGMRALGDAFYLRVDLPWLAEVGGEAISQSDIDQMAGAAAFLGDLASLVQPALAGDWIGIDDVPEDWQEELTDLAESMGGQLDLGIDQDTLDYSDVDLAGLLANNMTATEIDGGYDVTLNLRGLATELANTLPESVVAQDDMADIDDLPTAVGGITLLVDGDEVSQIRIDGYLLAKSLDDTASDDEFGEGDVTIVVDVTSDAGELLSVPGDAVTATFEELMETLGLLSNMMGSFG